MISSISACLEVRKLTLQAATGVLMDSRCTVHQVRPWPRAKCDSEIQQCSECTCIVSPCCGGREARDYLMLRVLDEPENVAALNAIVHSESVEFVSGHFILAGDCASKLRLLTDQGPKGAEAGLRITVL